MERANLACLCVLLALGAGAASAEEKKFIQPLYGLAFGGDLDLEEQLDEESEKTDAGAMDFDDDQLYGVIIGMETDDPGNVYLMYSRYDGSVDISGGSNPVKGADLTLDYIHFGGTLYFPMEQFQHFVSASIGATLMDGDNGLDETRFSMGFALGSQYPLTQDFGFSAEIRAMITEVDSDTRFKCPGDDGVCRLLIDADVFYQGQVTLGIYYRF